MPVASQRAEGLTVRMLTVLHDAHRLVRLDAVPHVERKQTARGEHTLRFTKSDSLVRHEHETELA